MSEATERQAEQEQGGQTADGRRPDEQQGGEEQGGQGRSVAEWVSFGIAAAILLAVAGLVVYYWLADPQGPPVLTIARVGDVREVGGNTTSPSSSPTRVATPPRGAGRRRAAHRRRGRGAGRAAVQLSGGR